MAVPFDTPVSAIEGVGTQAERLFQLEGVYTVYDLLRASSPALHSAVSSVASMQEVRTWRQMAVLLEVATMTPQWAEALVKAGITSLSELRQLALTDLTGIFTSARDEGLIPDVPTADQMAAMLMDAGRLEYAGAITGTVRDRDGNPVKGATVAAAGRAENTDERGRFRLKRLLLGANASLSVTAQGLQALTHSVTPRPTESVEVLQLTMLPELAIRPRPAGATSGRLSELNGDAMPALQGTDVTSGEVPVASLRSGDLLVLTEFYANGTDAKLVSKLLEFDGTRFVVHWVRLPKADLPAGAAEGDHFLRAGTSFRKVRMTPKKLNEYKKLLQVRRSLPMRPPPSTQEERYARAAETFALMSSRR